MGDTHFSSLVPGDLKVDTLGTTLTKIKKYTATIDPASVAANTVASEAFTVTGLAVGDIVIVNPGVATIGVAGAKVTGANELTITFVNPTASPIDPASSDWDIVAISS